jgi:hypothetical protein
VREYVVDGVRPVNMAHLDERPLFIDGVTVDPFIV